MSDAPGFARSFEIIDRGDLIRLAEVAIMRLDAAFEANPRKSALYASKILGVCLCQGAADHFLCPLASNGVHDFDMWAFFARQPDARLWNRSPFTADFGWSKFGRSPLDKKKYLGRRVDVLWRCIRVEESEGALNAIRRYFAEPRTASASALRQKAVVMAWPTEHAGEIAWQPYG